MEMSIRIRIASLAISDLLARNPDYQDGEAA